MTVQKLFIKNKYEGDGNNTTFPITFEWTKDHPEFIQVWVRNGAGVLAKTDNFLLKSGANDDIWNVSYPSVGEPLGKGETIVIVRELPLLQVLNLVNQGPFFAEDVEVTFDEVVMMIQQLNERLGRAFKVGVDIDGESSFDTTVPIVPGKTFRVNEAGTGFEVTEDPGQVYEKTVAEKDKAEAAATSAQKAAESAETWAKSAEQIAIPDGSIDNDKLAYELKTFLTPSMFKTEDNTWTEALQDCVNASAQTGLPTFIRRTLPLTHTVIVPSDVTIKGTSYNEYLPKIIVQDGCDLAFKCNGHRNTFENFIVTNYQNKYRNFVGFEINGDSAGNSDTYFIGVTVVYADKGCFVKGRNTRFINGLFSHCRYGIYYDFIEGLTGIRGCEINGVRFHGIGEELELGFENCAAIRIKDDTDSNLTVLNCICDQGCTFIEGFAVNVLIANNFVESFTGVLLKIETDNLIHPNTMCSWVITNNVFKGKQGAVYANESGQMVYKYYPDNLLKIKNYGRLLIANNRFSHCNKASIVLENVTDTSIMANTFTYIGKGVAGNNTAIEAKNSYVYVTNNVALDPDVILYDGDNSGAVCMDNNLNFGESKNYILKDYKRFGTFKTGTFGVEADFKLTDIPNGYFLLRRTDGGSCWLMAKNGNYVTSPSLLSGNNSNLDFITHTVNASTNKVTFNLERRNLSTGAFNKLTQPYVIELLY